MNPLANPPPTRDFSGEAEFGRECSGVSVERRILCRRSHKHPDSAPWMGPLMESLLSPLRLHWDLELWKAPASRTHSRRFAKSQALGHCAAAFGVRGACSRFRTRFMERLLSP